MDDKSTILSASALLLSGVTASIFATMPDWQKVMDSQPGGAVHARMRATELLIAGTSMALAVGLAVLLHSVTPLVACVFMLVLYIGLYETALRINS
jgi:hypothetical protein